MPNTRPAAYVPLSVLFVTGKTGTAILERFGLEGLGVWAAMLAEAGKGNKGVILFRHDEDWGAIGLAPYPPKFTLKDFLRFLGQRKQTRRTSQGRALYVQITSWERWNNVKQRTQARERMSRKRGDSERNNERTTSEHETNENEQERHPEAEAETEKFKGNALEAFRSALPVVSSLPVNNELQISKLLAFVGEQEDEAKTAATQGTIRGLARRLSEGSLAKVLESALSRNGEIDDRAAYIVGALKSEIREREKVMA